MHVVTYDSEKYESIQEAVAEGGDSLAVFGTFYKVCLTGFIGVITL